MSSSKRKTSHVSRACNQCRRKKSKCDGVRPSCGTCSVFNEACAYTDVEDGRRAASKEYVEALRARVRALEALLDARSSQAAPARSEQHLSDDLLMLGDAAHSPVEQLNGETSQQGEELGGGMDRLVIDEASGEINQFGETSALYHSSRLGTSPGAADAYMPALDLDAPVLQSSEGVDFLRFLPAGIILTAAQHDQLLDWHFCFFSSWTMRVDRCCFYRDMRRALSSTGDPSTCAQYSPLLHNAILALATAYTDDPSLSSPSIRAAYAARAKQAVEEERHSPSLATVLGLALLSSFYSGRAEHGAGWLFFGQATRLSQTLGLNIDSSPLLRSGQLSAATVAERTHAFWTLYCQDKLWSCWVGRQASLQTSDLTTLLPTVDAETDAAPALARADDSSMLAQPSYASSAFVASTTLCLLCARIMLVNYGLKSNRSKNSESLIADIRLQLDDWHSRLPACLSLPTQTTARGATPAVLMLHLAFHWLVILAHRPSALSSSGTAEAKDVAFKRCERSASRIILLWQLWRRLYGVRLCSITAVQVAFTAGATHLQLAAQTSPSALKRREEGVAAAREAVKILHEMSASWQSAAQSADILSGLIDDFLAPPASAAPSESVLPPALSTSFDFGASSSGPSFTPSASYTPLPTPPFDLCGGLIAVPELSTFGAMQHFDPLLGGMGLAGVDGTFGSHRLARDPAAAEGPTLSLGGPSTFGESDDFSWL